MLLSLYARISRFFDVSAHWSHSTIVTKPVFNDGRNRLGTNRALLSGVCTGRQRGIWFCGYDMGGGEAARGDHSSMHRSLEDILKR